jgi:hypothetical protein
MRSKIVFVAALCLALMLPASALGDVGSGPTTTALAEGGQPVQGQSSRVYMQETPESGVCIATGPSSGYGFPLTLTLDHKSHLSLLFTGEFGGLDANEEGYLSFSLDGGPTGSPGWSFTAPPEITRDAATISWTFSDVPKGTHTVAVGARVAGGNQSGQIDRCSLTVTVIEPSTIAGTSGPTAAPEYRMAGTWMTTDCAQYWQSVNGTHAIACKGDGGRVAWGDKSPITLAVGPGAHPKVQLVDAYSTPCADLGYPTRYVGTGYGQYLPGSNFQVTLTDSHCGSVPFPVPFPQGTFVIFLAANPPDMAQDTLWWDSNPTVSHDWGYVYYRAAGL